jgi:hypothetical protein
MKKMGKSMRIGPIISNMLKFRFKMNFSGKKFQGTGSVPVSRERGFNGAVSDIRKSLERINISFNDGLIPKKGVEIVITGVQHRLQPGSIAIPEMVKIPGFKLNEKISFSSFAISSHAITAGQYLCYLAGTGQKVPVITAEASKHSMKTLSPEEQVAYVNWLSQATGRKFDLPSDNQRQRAAKHLHDISAKGPKTAARLTQEELFLGFHIIVENLEDKGHKI